MVKRVILFLVVGLAFPLSVAAYDFSYTYQGVTLFYNIVAGNAIVVPEYNSEPYNSSLNWSGDINIPASVEYGGNTYAVTSIGHHALSGWYDVLSITIPNSVTTIGVGAFLGCPLLASTTIGNSVTSIGNGAFARCGSLSSIVSLADVPPALGERVFGIDEIERQVFVPCGKSTEYRSADGWNGFSNIQEICGVSSAAGVSVYSEGNSIVVEGVGSNILTLHDNAGNILSTRVQSVGEPLRFESLTSGTYYVKIGILPSRLKVVVR
ncbi:MAG: leucine-rich repeat protein [Bacteroidales bacterium]|nr:leucine-rich repeat protein [Bacteroidales bacterium]